jgi:hypothetical protein
MHGEKADPKLVVALRGTYLNVYWRGQSLFRVESTSSGFNVTPHEKYLVAPKLASQVTLTGRDFDISSLAEKGFIRRYEGPATIAKMKAAAGPFSGLEKTGCHEIAVRNAGVIDCEIAFPGKVSLDDGGDDRHGPRIAVIAPRRRPEGQPVRPWLMPPHLSPPLNIRNPYGLPSAKPNRERSFSREPATVCAKAPESETARRVKEMNFLSAHQSSNPTTPATQSVSPMCA